MEYLARVILYILFLSICAYVLWFEYSPHTMTAVQTISKAEINISHHYATLHQMLNKNSSEAQLIGKINSTMTESQGQNLPEKATERFA